MMPLQKVYNNLPFLRSSSPPSHAHQLPEVNQETEQLLERIVKGDEIRFEVDHREYIVVDQVLYSSEYANCNGVALVSPNCLGLSHYDLIAREKPETYLSSMLKKMLKYSARDELKAMVIGGDENHFQRISRILKEKRIPLINSFLDGWPEWKCYSTSTKKNPRYYKDLFVLPSQEVFLGLRDPDSAEKTVYKRLL